MTRLGTDTMELSPPRKKRNGKDLWYDPHLQEEVLRYFANPPLRGTVGITFEKKDGEDKETVKRYVDVIAKLREPKTPEDRAKDQWPVPEEIKDFHRISKNIVTGAVAVDQIETAHRKVVSLKAATEVHLHLYNSVPAIQCDPKSLDAAAPAFPGLDGSGVVIGIVDFGCDFRHGNFRCPSGATRIRFLWDQSDVDTEDGSKKEGPPSQAKPPKAEGFKYGREFNTEDINWALAAGDEIAYEKLRYTPPIAAHGTHVMDIAAGNGRELNLFNGKPGLIPPQPSAPGVAPNAQIVFVNLKTFERGFLGNSRYLLDAVDYVFRKADQLGMPAVVNLSLSTTGGPHDGTTLVEQGFEALVNARPGRAIITSAGNSYLLQSHVRGKAGRAASVNGPSGETAPSEIGTQESPASEVGTATILWNTDFRHTDPDNIKNEMEIWYAGDQELEVTLYASDPKGNGKRLGSVSLGETKELYAGATRVGRISHRKKDPNNKDNEVDIRLPTLEDVEGPWKIELASKQENQVPFHAWIEQSERGLARFVGDIDSQYTLASISCSNATLTVGAFDTAENASLAPPYEATSAGPIRPTAFNKKKEKDLRSKPELSAPGVTVVAARAHGGVTALSGTSMSAAHVSGLVALLFQLAQRSGRGPLSFPTTCKILSEAIQPPIDKPLCLQLGKCRILGPSSVEALLAEPTEPAEPPRSRTLILKPPLNPDRNAKLSAPLTTFVKTYAYLNGSKPEEVIDPFNQLFESLFNQEEDVRITIEPSN